MEADEREWRRLFPPRTPLWARPGSSCCAALMGVATSGPPHGSWGRGATTLRSRRRIHRLALFDWPFHGTGVRDSGRWQIGSDRPDRVHCHLWIDLIELLSRAARHSSDDEEEQKQTDEQPCGGAADPRLIVRHVEIQRSKDFALSLWGFRHCRIESQQGGGGGGIPEKSHSEWSDRQFLLRSAFRALVAKKRQRSEGSAIMTTASEHNTC